VRIAATSDFGRHLLLDWLDAFSADYPDVAFGLTLSDAVTSFLHEETDLAIRFGMPPDGALNARRLAANRRVLCAAPAYLERAGRPCQPADLGGHRFVLLHTRDGLQHDVTLRRLDAVVEYRLPSGQAWETNDGAVARAWLLAGRGIGFKSWWDVAADVRAGRLEVVLPDWETPAADVHALFHRRLLPLRVRLLLEFLAARFAAYDGTAAAAPAQGQLPIT
jgi:DNA-binding transcriptional LysR family regulator